MTAELQYYPEYKESGLPWIGKVPKHWDIERAKWLYQKMDRPVHETDNVVTCFRDGTVTLRKNRRTTGFTNSLKEIGYQGVRKGDLVIHAMDAFAGAVGVSDSDGKCTPVYAICTPKIDLDNRYYAYLVREMARSQWVLALARGIRERSTDFRFEGFSSQPVPIPSKDEQKAIADYLDINAIKVRRFIRNRRRLIELLNEQKQAIINQAVTRGLNPDVPLKPSGIDWLGDIPEHWRIGRIKTEMLNLNTRRVPLSGPERGKMTHHEYDYYGASGVIDKVDEYLFDDDLLLIAEDGANLVLRNLPLAIIARGQFWVNNHAHILKPKRGSLEYLAALLECINYLPWISGAAQPKLTKDRLMAIHIPVPPAPEQVVITEWINDNTRNLIKAIEKAKREIDLIREYRTRLIADVVTGKLDVRQSCSAVTTVQKDRTRRVANVPFRRAVFAAEIIHRLHNEPTFGHVKLEKLIFLCEKRCGVDIGSTYYRQAAGPYDNRALRSIDKQVEKQQWYVAQKEEKRYRYVPLAKAGDHKIYFDRYFAAVEQEFSNIIATFRTMYTQRCEIVATLYSAWEDLLAQNKDVTDDQVIDQVLHCWHPSKQQIDEDRWRRAIGWMREKGFTPKIGNSNAYD